MIHHVAVGALVGDAGVLLAHRHPDRQNAPDSWSLPGGHVEAGETPAQALVRELREELGIDAVVEGAPVVISREQAGPDELVMSVWVVHRWSGIPTNSAPEENDELRWVRAPELDGLAPAHWTCRSVVQQYAP